MLVNNPAARRWLFLSKKKSYIPTRQLIAANALYASSSLILFSCCCFFYIYIYFKKKENVVEVGKCLYRRRNRVCSSLLYCCFIHYASRGICIHAQRVQGSRQTVSIIVSNEHFGRRNHEREEEGEKKNCGGGGGICFFFFVRSVVGRRRGSAIRTELYLAARGLFYDYYYYRSKKPQKDPAANPLARPNKQKKKTTTTNKRKKKKTSKHYNSCWARSAFLYALGIHTCIRIDNAYTCTQPMPCESLYSGWLYRQGSARAHNMQTSEEGRRRKLDVFISMAAAAAAATLRSNYVWFAWESLPLSLSQF